MQDQLEDRGEDAVSERPVAEESEYVTKRPNANEPDNEIEVAVPENQVDAGNENNQLETTRRAYEVSEVYRETSVKGDKKFVTIKVGNDGFDRQYTKKMETLSSNVVKNSAQAQYMEDIKIMKPGKMISQKYSPVQVSYGEWS